MQIYAVGGAVRDKLLGYPVSEQDWVVVGATPEAMTRLGYRPVGKDFPVFLHPRTHEEYALARTERKTGPGYTGFNFFADPSVTLEDDLVRRDLTINAMAEDEQGRIIDPYGGQRDLENRLLRHVSAAFTEDPVRILRVARFAARYHHLGFDVAQETQTLMQQMVEEGEVDHLVPERIWKETSRALCERDPQVFITTLRNCGALARIMPEVDDLFGVPQPAQHHPEVDSGLHTLMALQQACLLSPSPEVRFATLVHDLGKAKTPADRLPRHIAHEQRSLPLIKALCQRLAVPNSFRDLALAVAQYHTHCHRALQLKASTVVKLLDDLDAWRRPERFAQFLLCCEADARGRSGFEARDYPQTEYLRQAHQACLQIAPKDLLQEGYSGKALGEQLHNRRIHAVQSLKTTYPTAE